MSKRNRTDSGDNTERSIPGGNQRGNETTLQSKLQRKMHRRGEQLAFPSGLQHNGISGSSVGFIMAQMLKSEDDSVSTADLVSELAAPPYLDWAPVPISTGHLNDLLALLLLQQQEDEQEAQQQGHGGEKGASDGDIFARVTLWPVERPFMESPAPGRFRLLRHIYRREAERQNMATALLETVGDVAASILDDNAVEERFSRFLAQQCPDCAHDHVQVQRYTSTNLRLTGGTVVVAGGKLTEAECWTNLIPVTGAGIAVAGSNLLCFRKIDPSRPALLYLSSTSVAHPQGRDTLLVVS